MSFIEKQTLVRILKLGGSTVFYALAELARAVRSVLRIPNSPSCVAIYYHHVASSGRESFAHQMDHLLRWTIPIRADSQEILQNGFRYSIVTGDDGWDSFAEQAVPELLSRDIPVVMFAISHRPGGTIDEVEDDRIVTEARLGELARAGVLIGSHGANHKRMTQLAEKEVRYELVESRSRLAKLLGKEPALFCFPYGDYNPRLMGAAREAGYARAFTTVPSLADLSQFEVGRVPTDPSDWMIEFHLKLMGAYRWLPTAFALKRWILQLTQRNIASSQRAAEESNRSRTA